MGSTSNFILRRMASRLTSFMTGRAPVPVPTTAVERAALVVEFQAIGFQRSHLRRAGIYETHK